MQDAYNNRKEFHSIILQGCCDSNMVFTHVHAGSPTRMHNAKAFNASGLDTVVEKTPANPAGIYVQPVLIKKGRLMVHTEYVEMLDGLTAFRWQGLNPFSEWILLLCGLKYQTYFSKFTLPERYGQPTDKESKGNMALSHIARLYEFTIVLFGLKVVGANMRHEVEGITHTEHYSDDILVATDTWKWHLVVVEDFYSSPRLQAQHFYHLCD